MEFYRRMVQSKSRNLKGENRSSFFFKNKQNKHKVNKVGSVNYSQKLNGKNLTVVRYINGKAF